MDSRDRDHRLLAAFLAGDLDPAAARRWDAHLLECEQCWRAVREDRTGRQAARRLRRGAPPEPAHRVPLALQLTAPRGAAGRPPRAPAPPRTAGRPGRSPCPPVPRAYRVWGWRGRRNWGSYACTALTAGPPSWWQRRSRRRNWPR